MAFEVMGKLIPDQVDPVPAEFGSMCFLKMKKQSNDWSRIL